ncbi:MAG: dockerin type I repeat-containing protein [Ruminococcus sp.]|nr:dockerin type I repeat-containing protein [Ruminococcus sp.]
MKQNYLKKLIAISVATVLVAGCAELLSITSADAAGEVVLALGDDTMLAEDGETASVEWIADYLSGTAINDAQMGLTSSELVEMLQTDSDVLADVASADVVVVSVGVYDILNAGLYENEYVPDVDSYSTLSEMLSSIPTTNAFAMVDEAMANLEVAITEISENIETSVSLIQAENQDADIIIHTVENPMAVEVTDTDLGLSTNRQTVAYQLCLYLNVTLEGGTNTYYNYTLDVEKGVNESIRELQGVYVADIYDGFYGASGEETLGLYLTNFGNLRMTFTPVGQVLLAAAAIEADENLHEGDGSVITAAYDATGEREYLSTERSSLDSIIQTVEAYTPAETTTETPTEPEETLETGDIDNNGVVNVQDAYAVMVEYSNIAAGLEPAFTDVQNTAADINLDGDITVQDAYLIQVYTANIAAGNDVTWDDVRNS